MLKILHKSDLSEEIAVVVGTRPGIIKFSPVIRELGARNAPFFIIHTGQHYSYNMDRQFFDDLGLPSPRYTNDSVSRETYHGAQTAEMLKGVECALLDAKPCVVIVGGDANTNLAGALAARKLGIKLAHMEAGLRSHDWQMPEEHNRVIIDHISDILLPPTEQARQNLLDDNVRGEIHTVGNPIVDAVYQNIELAKQKSEILSKLQLESKQYLLLTMHREENVDHEPILRRVVEILGKLIAHYDLDVVLPIHPRTRKRLEQFGLWGEVRSLKRLRIIEAVGYLDFLLLLSNTRAVLTDSGGIQEEACILRVPCVTLRNNTERPETVEVGANQIGGSHFNTIREAMDAFSTRDTKWENPFGDGKAALRIVEILFGALKK